MNEYRLLPDIRISEMGGCFYLYDQNCKRTGVVKISTQKISKRIYDVLTLLQTGEENRTFLPMEALAKRVASHPAGDMILRKLVHAGYIEPRDTRLEEIEAPTNERAGEKNRAEDLQSIRETHHDAFEKYTKKHYFRTPSFFHLPENIPEEIVDVGICGVPFSTVIASNGTRFAPDALRAISQDKFIWFEIFKKGFYSDSNCTGGMPEVMCKNVVLKDLGDIGQEVRSVGDLYETLDAFVGHISSLNAKMLFVGGDHAVTSPIVSAYQRRLPNLAMIHLDAHNDLFYSLPLSFSHANPMGQLLLLDDVKHFYSFGLRTFSDSRMKMFERISEIPELQERIHYYGLGPTKRLLAEEGRLARVFTALPKGTPCYLSIDLDVLSASEIGGKTSTPKGMGLAWHELFEFIRVAFSSLNIVAADIVEFDATSGDHMPEELSSLLLLLVDQLAKMESPKWADPV